MRLFPFLLSCFTVISFSLISQINVVIPKWVNPIGVESISAVNKKQIKDGYYYVLIDEQYNVVEKQSYFHYAMCAVTEEALVNVSQLEFSYDPAYEKAFLHAVKIHRGTAVIDKTASLELRELNEENQRNNGILNGRKTLYTNLSDVRKGDIIEYSYSLIGQNPIMGSYFNFNLSLSYSVPVGKIYERVIFPKNTELSLLNKNTAVKPLIKQTTVNDYVWEVNNPKVLSPESSIPAWYNPFQQVQMSNIKSWQEVKKHCKTLLNISAYDKKSLQTIADSITNLKQDKEATITSVIEFVQTHIRYSGNEGGIYSHVPRSPEYVLKNRFGDCKEKSVLLCEMFKLIGVESYPVLINTVLGHTIADQNPSINIFDHCISVFVYNGKYVFVDPTISYQRGNFKLRTIPAYETGMILDNSNKPFEKIPTDTESRSDAKEEFFIEASGNAKLKVTTTYTGASADVIRYTFLTNSIYDIQETYKEYYNKFSKDIEVLDTVSFIDDEGKNEFVISEYYLLNRFWAVEDSGKTKVITKDFLPYSLSYKFNYGEEHKRIDPLEIAYPLNTKHEMIIQREGRWSVEDDAKSEDCKFFSYSFITHVKEDKLYLTYTYRAKTGIIEPADYPEYKKKMGFIDRNIVFTLQEKPQAKNIMSFNWALLLTILIAVGASWWVMRSLYKRPYPSLYPNQYDSIGGWLVLLGIGIALNPLVLLISLAKEYSTEMGYNYFVYFFDVESAYFSPLKGYYIFFLAFLNVVMLVASVYTAILFFQKKASFRICFSVFRIFNAVFLIVNVIILHSLYGDSSDAGERQLITGGTTSMIRVVIETCIWVPYIWLSERSRFTFTNGNLSVDSTKDHLAISGNKENLYKIMPEDNSVNS